MSQFYGNGLHYVTDDVATEHFGDEMGNSEKTNKEHELMRKYASYYHCFNGAFREINDNSNLIIPEVEENVIDNVDPDISIIDKQYEWQCPGIESFPEIQANRKADGSSVEVKVTYNPIQLLRAQTGNELMMVAIRAVVGDNEMVLAGWENALQRDSYKKAMIHINDDIDYEVDEDNFDSKLLAEASSQKLDETKLESEFEDKYVTIWIEFIKLYFSYV